MNDAQQAPGAESTDVTESIVAEDKTGKKPSQRKGKRRAVVFLFLLMVIGGSAGAAWYYQSMWLPQARSWVVAWLPSDETPDLMAAPMVDKQYLAKAAKSGSTFMLSAIPETEPVPEPMPEAKPAATKENESHQPVENEQVVAPVAVAESDTAKQQVEVEAASAVSATPSPVNVTESQVSAPEVKSVMDDTAVLPGAPARTMQQARQAFWSRDLVAAETMYTQLVRDDAQNTDAWGELGNLYYLQAKWREAASAYTEAALRLLEKGEYPRAMYLNYIIRGLDPAQSLRIDEQLRRMQQPVNH